MCDGTPCPCNIEPKPKKQLTPEQNRKGAIASVALLGPILLCVIVTIVDTPGHGVLVLAVSWLCALLAAAGAAIRR